MYVKSFLVNAKKKKKNTGYMGKFFDNGSIATKCHIMNVQKGLGGHAKDGRCA